MSVLNFADFARRGPAAIPTAPRRTEYVPPPVTDRWALLHKVEVAAVEPMPDFWGDLQIRLAYPTLHIRHS